MDAHRAPSPAAPDDAAPAGTPPDATALDVSSLPPLDELLGQLIGPLETWMPAQRWYAHKGSGEMRAAIRGWAPLRVAPGHLVLLVVVSASPTDGSTALYQVPLVMRRAAAPSSREEGAEIAVLPVPGGPLRVDDAARDVEGRAALIGALISGEGALGSSLALAPRRPEPGAPLPLGRAMRSRVLAGEQSNTSIIVETEGASPLIVKLFRVLQDGENPDVVLQGALTAIGSTRVPAMVGSARIAVAGIRTHALLAQEFLPGLEDAWRVALRRAAAGEQVGEWIGTLGMTVAEVHRDLARALGTSPADRAAVERAVEGMRRRLAAACAEIPLVAVHRDALEGLLSAALTVPWPAMQRIHGDLHLGQVLWAPERGWVMLDFEGEPLRPLAERSLPDSPLRDLAGMLRSLDYAAGAVQQEQGVEATGWAADARAAFLAGYGRGTGSTTPVDGPSRADDAARADDPSQAAARAVLLAAFEADKAVYEALYEARNRPAWLPIPLAALERITASGAAAG